MDKNKKEELIRTIKFTIISMSAGLIQIGSFTLLYELIFKERAWALSYVVSVILSVIWNFTINRKFTFKSANNIPKAMLLVLAFYVVFTPATMFLGAYLSDGIINTSFTLAKHLNWPGILVTLINMVLNLVLEYLYDRFVVFKDSINTNELAKKDNNIDNN